MTRPAFKLSVCREAEHIVNSDRPDRYGFVGDAMPKVAQLATLQMTQEELTGGVITSQMCIKVMKAYKMIRDTYSPDNPDHMRDECGYTELLWQLRELGIK